MALDYFRRPSLAGKNVQRTTFATVRGSLRRSNADGTSAVPYFPGASATQTLNITHQGGSVTATLTGNGIATVLSDINTALGADATASDADGTIEIRSSVGGSAGLIQVTGGSAASALGFETFAGTRIIQARGSQIASSPESRVGNAFDVGFFHRGENFTAEAVTRGMARIASNSDVLWLDQVKDRIAMKTVSFALGAGGLFITPTSTQRLFVSGSTSGGLTSASTKKDLIPYYQLIDTATGLPAASQVVAVVRGTPVGAPPYTDSPSWADVTGKNVLGLDQTKVSAAAITTITEGRYVQCGAATFVTTGVKPGDFANITGATNTSRWSNNGKRWVVEEVLSETVLSLKPMSRSELTVAGVSVTDIHPILELNDEKAGIETFGSLTISTGPFAHNVNLVVRPAIPTGATYELRAAVPASDRDLIGFENAKAVQNAIADYASDNQPTHNGTLSGLVPSLSGGNVSITSGSIRWNGHEYKVPATTILNSSLTDGLSYVYWDDLTSTIVVSTSATSFTNVLTPGSSTNRGHLLGVVFRAAGTISSVTRANRYIADAARSVTVGSGGQFSTLSDALNHISYFASAFAESTSSSGTYPHFEIVLVSDTTYSGNVATFNCPGLLIRGVSDSVTLTLSQPLPLGTCTRVEVRDLKIAVSGSISSLVSVETDSTSVRLVNLEHTAGTVANVIAGSFTVSEVLIDSCSFRVTTGVVSASPTSAGQGLVAAIRSDFTLVSGVAAPQMFHDSASSSSTLGRLHLEGCRFLGSWLTNSTTPLVTNSTNATSEVIVQDCLFALGNHASATASTLFSITGRGLLERVRNTGKIPKIVSGLTTKVVSCSFSVNTEGSEAAVAVKEAFFNTIAGQDTDANVLGGTGLVIYKIAQGNTVTGTFATGIRVDDEFTNIVLNTVTLTNGTAFPLIGIQSTAPNDVVISENNVSMPVRPAASPHAAPYGIAQTGSSLYRLTVCDNNISLSENGSAIVVGTSASPSSGEQLTIRGNHCAAPCTASGLSKIIECNGDISFVEITGNIGYISGAGNSAGIFLASGTFSNLTVSSNNLLLDAVGNSGFGLYYCSTPVASQTVRNNIFQGGSATQRLSGFRGLTQGNYLTSPGTVLVSDLQGIFSDNFISCTTGSVTIGSGRYDNNTFTIPDVNVDTVVVDLQFTNNSVSGGFNGGTATTDHMTFSSNKVAGAVTITNSASTKLIAVGNECLSHVTISPGTGDTDILFYGNYVGGSLAVQANGSISVSSCVVAGSGTHTFEGAADVLVSGCQIAGPVNMTGFALRQTLSDCTILGKVEFTASLSSNPRLSVQGCTIQPPTQTVSALVFPTFGFYATTYISIVGNTIVLQGANVPQGHGILFQGDVSYVTISSNKIRLKGTGDPGGSGTFNFACVQFSGATASDLITISSNSMDKEPDQNIRPGGSALVINYKFVNAVSGSQIGGAGNILATNGTASGATGQGGQFFHTGPGAYSL